MTLAIQDPTRSTLWIGAKVVCKEQFEMTLDDIQIKISVGTKGKIVEFEGPYVMVWLEDSPEIEITQLRGDFVYYWELAVEPPPKVFASQVPMILDRHPDHQPDGRSKVKYKYIGYWATNSDPKFCSYAQREDNQLPWPGDFVDTTWDPKERDLVVEYLKKAPKVCHWMGFSYCRLGCEEVDMGVSDHGDGIFVWPEGFSHYVEIHGVRPPEEFVKHVLEQERRMTPFMNSSPTHE